MASCGLAIELEAARFKLSDDIPITEACEAPHLRRNYYRVIATFSGRRQIGSVIALAPRFN
jgi:hypothetical protein